MLLLVTDCCEEFNCNLKMRIALFKLTTIDSIFIRVLPIPSSRTPAPKPTALSRGFYCDLNSAFSEITDYNASKKLSANICKPQLHQLTFGKENLGLFSVISDKSFNEDPVSVQKTGDTLSYTAR